MTYASHYASKVRSKRRGRAVDAQGTPAVLTDRLDQLIDASSNLSGVWPEIARVWAERQQTIFRTSSHGRWAPLRVATIIRKQREGVSTEPLVETHTLIRAVTSETPRASSPHFVVFGPQRGEAIDYAKFHMRGMGVPQRHPVPRFTPTERKRMIEKISEHLGFNPSTSTMGRA
jgi:hypothetical protein